LIYEFEIEKNQEAYFNIALGFNLENVGILVNGETVLGSSQGSLNKLISLRKI